MANIFDQYAQSQITSSLNPFENERQNQEQLVNLRTIVEEPIFSKLKIDFKPIYPITHMVVSNNQLLIALENRQILKIDQMNPKTPIEIDLNSHITDKTKSSIISDIFIDPTGKHCLFSLCVKADSSQFSKLKVRVPFENFYFGKRISILSKLRGHLITAVGWNTLNLPDSGTSNSGNVLIGTSKGKIFETQFNSDDRFLGPKEAFIKQVCELPLNDNNSSQHSYEPICAINIIKLRQNQKQLNSVSNPTYCILVATSNFLYSFIGDSQTSGSSGYLKDIANSSASATLFRIFENPAQKMHREILCSLDSSKLDLFYPPVLPQSSAISMFPKSFGWLSKPGIFFNEIRPDLNVKNASKMFEEAEMILFNNLSNSSLVSPNDMPLAIVSTEFHILLLYPTVMRAVCVLNKEVVFEDPYSIAYGNVLGICRDPIRGKIWVFTQHAVYRYKIVKEDRNIWEIHLKNKNFEQARSFAHDDVKLDSTTYEEALYYFEKGLYRESAILFSSVRSKTFEEIALKFIELRENDQEALKHYLSSKLETLSPLKDRTQVIILLLWIIEINLNQLGELKNRMEDCDLKKEDILKLKVEYNSIEEKLRNLINNSNYKACFKKNKKIIYNLIMTHTNQTILIYFAEQIDDFERLIEHYLQISDYDKALTILRKEECLPLYYRYSPLIIQERPTTLVSQLLPLAKLTDFNKLIPALVHFDNNLSNDPKNSLKREKQCNEILRYLEFCAFTLKTNNSLVHNYLIALYAQYQPDKLLTYLQSRGNDEEINIRTVPYDVRYAARLCTQLGLSSATVHLLATMGAIEEAVEQALANNDVELAKNTVKNISADEKPDLLKRLWMKIAKFIIKKSQEESSHDGSFNAKMATEILNESNSLLKIEDILPYFPEFSTIDHFKDAIRQSLEEYNKNIESLRQDMKAATESAQEIRDEIKKHRDRFTLISSSDRCSLCDYFILTKAFYLFQCGHLFHTDCLSREVRPLLSSMDRKKFDDLNAKLKAVNSSLQNQTIEETNLREKISEAIQDLIASECYFCGNLMISSIDKPFISNDEIGALKGWD